MATLLVKNAAVLVTMDEQRREIRDGGLYARDGVIQSVGPSASLPQSADTVFDARGQIVIPGLVNTHHHLFQTMTRAVPGAQDATLFNWLQTLYPIWARMTPEHIRVSALVGLAEMALSGCTTSSDHLYIFPNGARLEDEIHAAQMLGVRFHAMRGAMSIGRSKGGLPPDSLVENEQSILDDCQRVITTFHDPSPHAMIRVGVAPCSPFSVSMDLMRDAANLARQYGVRLHTHLAENTEDIAYSRETFGMRPGQYVEELGWCGSDVWHAHCVQLDAAEIDLFARTRTGIAHCPCSNMRLGSGIAPVRELLAANVDVGLGVDGSASNDSGNLLNEARQALLLQRVKGGSGAMSARQALELATLGGAAVLGRQDIGALVAGRAADFATFALDRIEFAGAEWDPVAALVFCGPVSADHVFAQGRAIVARGVLTSIELPQLLAQHRRLAIDLVDGH